MQCVYQAMTAHLLGHRIACRHVLRYDMQGGLDSFDVVHRPSAVTNPGPRTEKKISDAEANADPGPGGGGPSASLEMGRWGDTAVSGGADGPSAREDELPAA